MSDPKRNCAIGVDIGGTSVRLGLVGGDGTVAYVQREPGGRGLTRDALVELVREGVRNANAVEEHGDGSLRVGVAVPGILDEERRSVVRAVNVPALEGWDVRGALATGAGVAARLFTDAEAATWAEFAARRAAHTCFAHLRLGSGAAFGVVRGQEPLRLDRGRTQHLDFLVADATESARPCACGRRGCLETIASGPSLIRAAADAGFASLSDVQAGFDNGQAAAATLVLHAAEAICTALENIADRFAPAVVSLGGGVIEAVPALARETTTTWNARVRGRVSCLRMEIVPSALGDRAGVIGAALLARRDDRDRGHGLR